MNPRATPPRPTPIWNHPASRAVTAELATRAALDLVDLARELLLLDASFEDAFPCDRNDHAPGLVSALERVLRREAFAPVLPAPLRRMLDDLAGTRANGDRTDERPAAPDTVAIAEALLAAAVATAHHSSRAHLLLAQRHWMASRMDRAEDHIDNALSFAARPREAGGAWLHRSILRADRGELVAATTCARAAAELLPDHLATQFTCGTYALVAGESAVARGYLGRAATLGTRWQRRARLLALPSQLAAMARRDYLKPNSVPAVAAEVTSLMSCAESVASQIVFPD